jgi:GT2 family glycosyltransferase
MPVYNPPVRFLKDAIKSVMQQLYENWELCICDNGSNRQIKAVLARYKDSDNRIRVYTNEVNEGIAEGTNKAISLATGDYVGFLDHDDILDVTALYYVCKAINAKPETDVVYTDRDHVNERNARLDPYLKPDWAPYTLFSHNYVIHFLVVRRALLERIGPVRKEYEGSQDYDLILRLSEVTSNIGHIPRILYSWRRHSGSSSVVPKTYAYDNAVAAIKASLTRRGIAAQVEKAGPFGPYKIVPRLTGQPRISLVISSWDLKPYLERCVSSVLNRTTYKNYELIVTTNNQNAEHLIKYCRDHGIAVCLNQLESYYSEMNNNAAKLAGGDYVVFLNDDTEVLTPDWLEEMLSLCQLNDVGAVGPLLLEPDGRIQYTYSVTFIDRDGNFYHFSPHALFRQDCVFGFPSNIITNVSSVSGACLMTKKELFLQQKGFDSENFPLAFQDIDYCHKLREAGFHILFTPYAKLVHHGAGTKRNRTGFARGIYRPDYADAYRFCQKHLLRLTRGDPYFNRNIVGVNSLLRVPPLFNIYKRLPNPHDRAYYELYGFPLRGRGETLANRERLKEQIYLPLAKRIKDALVCSTALDVGCGLGELVESLRSLGVNAFGIEYSKDAYSLIPDKLKNVILTGSIADPNICGRVGEVLKIDRFDVLIAMEVLEHIPEYYLRKALQNISRLSDIVVFTTPNPNLWDNDDVTHVCVRPKEYWVSTFRDFGFKADAGLTLKIFGVTPRAQQDDSTRLVFSKR